MKNKRKIPTHLGHGFKAWLVQTSSFSLLRWGVQSWRSGEGKRRQEAPGLFCSFPTYMIPNSFWLLFRPDSHEDFSASQNPSKLEWSPSDTKEQLVSLSKWLHFAPGLDLGSRGVFSPGWGRRGRRRIDTRDAQGFFLNHLNNSNSNSDNNTSNYVRTLYILLCPFSKKEKLKM